MSERELFIEHMLNENPTNNVEFMDEFGWFYEPITELRWLSWQASANRKGYKLAPVEATDAQWEAAIDAYSIAMDGKDILSESAFYDIYEAMLGAVE